MSQAVKHLFASAPFLQTGLSEIGMTDYKRILSLDSAMAIVSFRKDEVNYERKYFVSYPDSVMVLKFTANRPGMQNLIFSYGSNPEAIGDIKTDRSPQKQPNEICSPHTSHKQRRKPEHD